MAQPEYLLAQLQTLSLRSDLISILDAWSAYLDAHGVPPLGGSLVDRLAYHAALRGITVQSLWNGNLQAPSQILISSSPGFAFDVSNISSLWQDAAGTIPVTEPGDPVARVDDVSSQGNHALQADTNKQPTYQIDVNGNAYLDFDGVDDFLQVSALNLSGATSGLLLVAFARDTYAADVLLEHTTIYTGTPGAFLANVTGAGVVAFSMQGTSTNSSAAATPGAVPGPFVASTFLDTAAPTAAAAFADSKLNGAAFGSPATANPTSPGFVNADLFIAARAGTGLFLDGRLYGAVVRAGSVTANQKAALEGYYAARSLS
jgi:hypothetical protein